MQDAKVAGRTVSLILHGNKGRRNDCGDCNCVIRPKVRRPKILLFHIGRKMNKFKDTCGIHERMISAEMEGNCQDNAFCT